MVKVSYTSCGGNKTPNSVDWGHNNLICYASAHSVVLGKYSDNGKVIDTLVGHSDRVNAVKWIRKDENGSEHECVSASTDKSIIVWQQDSNGNFELSARLTGHSGPVTIVDAKYITNDNGDVRTLIASASVDSTVKIWERKHGEASFTCIQSISLGNGFALDVAWHQLPGCEVPLLAYGGDDQKINLLVEQKGQFVTVQKLLGHEDWLRCLEFTTDGKGDVLLASSAQDCYIRIWRISQRTSAQALHQDLSKLNLDVDIRMKETTFQFSNGEGKEQFYAVSLESVLYGHENWIYGLHWKAQTNKDSSLSLVSASMDKTVVIWEADTESGVWLEKVKVGEVGGSLPGFYGGLFSPDGTALLAHGYQGSFHLWKLQDSGDWIAVSSGLGGHFEAVQDLAWEPEGGEFLLSVSTDQTTRLHAVWNHGKPDKGERSWCELARPQVHGYDLTCITCINRYSFASGADEKVVRVFDATRNFIENLGQVSKLDVSEALKDKSESSAPHGASVPALGLSNKAVFEGQGAGEEEEEDQAMLSGKTQYPEVTFSALHLQEPPGEVDLLQNTLWPEAQKLYGHGNELFAAACHPSGNTLATACKAQKAEHASIILWDTKTWRQITQLTGLSLTITQLVFSHNGHYLLAVSRDRTWALYQQNGGGFALVAHTDKKTSVHSRIIWGAAWSHDDKYFVTVSRDKKAVLWTQGGGGAGDGVTGSWCPADSPLTLSDSATAVHMAPCLYEGSYLLAVGLDNGTIGLYLWEAEKSWQILMTLDNRTAHHQSVKRVKFRPVVGETGVFGSSSSSGVLQLASCGADHLVRVYAITMPATDT